jgi:hypothetical protein
VRLFCLDQAPEVLHSGVGKNTDIIPQNAVRWCVYAANPDALRGLFRQTNRSLQLLWNGRGQELSHRRREK